MQNKLSIIVPAFNEESTIREVLLQLNQLELIEEVQKEIIVINDDSSDQTEHFIQNFIQENSALDIKLFNQKTNQGKGAALHLGINKASGNLLIPQDADLELDPSDINLLLAEMIHSKLDVVYGSRFNKKNHLDKNAAYYANIFLTKLSNIFTGLKITDMETCYKLMDSKIAKSLVLKEKRFGFEPEITAKLAKVKAIRFGEVPIKYEARTHDEGKKIGWKDGFKAIYCIIKYAF